MDNKNASSTFSLDDYSLQDYLSIGYVYLLVLGIAKDSIYYGFIEVNFLKYSNVFDVLLSPISYIFETYKIPLALIGFFILMYIIGKIQEWYKKKKKDEKPVSPIPPKQAPKADPIFVLAIFFFSFYIGTGIGGGYQFHKIIKEKSAVPNHYIYLNDAKEDPLPVKLVGQNSQYIFYVAEKGDRVSIIPINGNVFKVERIPDEERKKKFSNEDS